MKSLNNIQIVIPMSGFGERFRKAGYKIPKPLIEVDGKPIISHVIDMFPGELNFLFICNNDHLTNPTYHLKEILNQYCPTGRIAGIPSHKLGPVYALRQVEHLIDPYRPVVINYCDFTCHWKWQHFKEFIIATACIGAIPAYKGFHPHSLGSTNYAYMREEKGWLIDIQEKQPFTNNRMQEYASSGTYYFATGDIMKTACREAVEQRLTIGGEYYVSLAYKPLLAKKHPIAIYPIQHFMQWGTPEDLKEYIGWSATFRRLIKPQASLPPPQGTIIIPMAGLGQRFATEGYTVTKPLIPVSGKPMVVQAVHDLPPALHHVFVLRHDMPGWKEIGSTLRQIYPNALIKMIPSITDGQACTALIGLDSLEKEIDEIPTPIAFGACDNGMLYDSASLQTLINNPDIDIIVWGVRGHANAIRHPQMFGWISAENGFVKHISVKKPLNSPMTDPIVLGTFTFRRAKDFRRCVQRLIARNERVNGEFYLDSCINEAIGLGLRCHLFEVDSYLSWGTPNDLRTFEYWQSCFHKWPSHPYSLSKDTRISPGAILELKNRYQETVPSVIKSPT